MMGWIKNGKAFCRVERKTDERLLSGLRDIFEFKVGTGQELRRLWCPSHLQTLQLNDEGALNMGTFNFVPSFFIDESAMSMGKHCGPPAARARWCTVLQASGGTFPEIRWSPALLAVPLGLCLSVAEPLGCHQGVACRGWMPSKLSIS